MAVKMGLDPEFGLVNKRSGMAMSAHEWDRVSDGKEIPSFFPSDLFAWRRRGDFKDRGVTPYLADETGAANVGQRMSIDRDGVALEMRNGKPSSCRDYLVPYAAEGLRTLNYLVSRDLPDYRLTVNPVIQLTKKSLSGDVPEDVLEFGCNPDIDAYSLLPKSPTMPEGLQERFLAGHLHFSAFTKSMTAKGKDQYAYSYGWDYHGLDDKGSSALAIVFDYLIGLPLVALLGEPNGENEAKRREFYGQAGSHRYHHENDERLTKIGHIEYRVPSSRIMLSPTILSWAFGIGKMLHNQIFEGYPNPSSPYNKRPTSKELLLNTLGHIAPMQQVAEIINTHDVRAAENLYPHIYQALPGYKEDSNDLTVGANGGSRPTPFFFKAVVDTFVTANRQGIFFEDDLVKNWGLYDNFYPQDHKYWGIHSAMAGYTDHTIFPMRDIAVKLFGHQQKDIAMRHPLNGGGKSFANNGVATWLDDEEDDLDYDEDYYEEEEL